MGKRSKNFATVIYPDSAPDDWQNRLADTHCRILISPLHDQDINPDGEVKKPHYHVLFMSDSLKTEQQIREIFSSVGGVGLEIVQSSRGYARYLCHLDNPEKHQYNQKEVLSLNGADYSGIVLLSVDDDLAIDQMCDWIHNTDCSFFYQLCDYARSNEPTWNRVLRCSGAVYMREYIKSFAYHKKIGFID